MIDLEVFDYSLNGCPKCHEVEDFGDAEWPDDPNYVHVWCYHCDYEWLERWEPETVVPPYSESEAT